MIRPLVLWNVSPNSMINQLISMYISRFGARDMRNSFYCNINPISQCFSITNTSITFFVIRPLPLYASRYIAVPKLYIQRYKKTNQIFSQQFGHSANVVVVLHHHHHTYTLAAAAALTLGRLLLLLLPPPCAAPARFYQAWPVLFQAHINTFHLDSRPHSVTV